MEPYVPKLMRRKSVKLKDALFYEISYWKTRFARSEGYGFILNNRDKSFIRHGNLALLGKGGDLKTVDIFN